MKLLFFLGISEACVSQVLSLPDPCNEACIVLCFFLNVSGAHLNWHIQ